MSKLEELIAELCPDGVKFVELGKIGIIGNTGVDKKINPNEKYVKLLNYMDVYRNRKITNGSIKMEVTATDKKIDQCDLKKGDVFITPTSETIDDIGHAGVVIEDIPNAVYSYHLMRIRLIRDDVSPNFISYLFESDTIQRQILKRATGLTRYGLSKGNFEKLSFPIPPLPVQREIVRILDNFTELTEELTEELTAELTARKKQYEYYRDYLIKESSSNIVKLSEVVNIYLGLTATPTYTETGVTFISAKNTSSDYLNLDNVKYISRSDFEKATSNAKPKRGDVLFTRVGSNLGHPVIVETDMELCIFVSLGYLRVKNDEVVLNSFLKHWMNTELFWSQVRKNVHGAAKVNLNTGWLKDFDIILPSLEKQQNIVEILDKFEILCNDISASISAEIEARTKQYEYYRDKLLTFKELV